MPNSEYLSGMKNLIAAIGAVLLAGHVWAQDLNVLKDYVEKACTDWNIPGLAVSIVKDDSLVFSEGFGVITEGKKDKVDGNTMFAIASNTKAYTASCVAMLVDEGKLQWDDKVIEYLPWFQMYSPYVTEAMTVRDLLCHRSGLATFSGDLIWYGSNHSREEVVKRARFLKPAHGFRETWGYSNIMFLAAGLIVEEVSGMSWDEFVHARIFKPLGMDRAITSTHQLKDFSNVASPHNDVNGKNLVIEYLNWDNIAPAGSIITSANDQAKWIKLQLKHGKWGTKSIFSKAQQDVMWSPHSIEEYSAGAQQLWPGKHFELYGLGWSIYDYFGYKVVAHGGGYDGMISQTALVPELGLGFTILSNNINSLPYALMFQILETYIQPEERKDWSAVLLDFKKYRQQRDEKEKQEKEAARNKEARFSLPLKGYTGKYHCDVYGSATVSLEKDQLVVQFDHTAIFKGSLNHWHYDTFQITMTEVPSLPSGTCRFTLNEAGEVESMRIDIPNPDFDFTEFDFKKVE